MRDRSFTTEWQCASVSVGVSFTLKSWITIQGSIALAKSLARAALCLKFFACGPSKHVEIVSTKQHFRWRNSSPPEVPKAF